MGIDVVQRSQQGLDIPVTASALSTASTLAATTASNVFTPLAELPVSATGTVTNFYLINSAIPMTLMNKVINYQMANKDTRFENLVFAITNGYAARGDNPFSTPDEFATRACDLARAIAFRMDMYSS